MHSHHLALVWDKYYVIMIGIIFKIGLHFLSLSHVISLIKRDHIRGVTLVSHFTGLQ